jgi:hypothetical protein
VSEPARSNGENGSSGTGEPRAPNPVNAAEMALQIDIAAAIALWRWRDELMRQD